MSGIDGERFLDAPLWTWHDRVVSWLDPARTPRERARLKVAEAAEGTADLLYLLEILDLLPDTGLRVWVRSEPGTHRGYVCTAPLCTRHPSWRSPDGAYFCTRHKELVFG